MYQVKHRLFLSTQKALGTNIENSCVYVYGNDNYGTEGLLLNARICGYVYYDTFKKVFIVDVKDSDLKNKSNIKCYPLYLGGNSPTSGIFFIHAYKNHVHLSVGDMNVFLQTLAEWNSKKFSEEKLKIHDDVYFGTPSAFDCIQEHNQSDDKFRFYTGYMYWESGVFEQELQKGFWKEIESRNEFFYDIDALNIKVKEENNKLALFQSPYIGFDPVWN
jgi:putative AlgH/UPF0301 family transcriptional regulator